jgi:hypothetical protein
MRVPSDGSLRLQAQPKGRMDASAARARPQPSSSLFGFVSGRSNEDAVIRRALGTPAEQVIVALFPHSGAAGSLELGDQRDRSDAAFEAGLPEALLASSAAADDSAREAELLADVPGSVTLAAPEPDPSSVFLPVPVATGLGTPAEAGPATVTGLGAIAEATRTRSLSALSAAHASTTSPVVRVLRNALARRVVTCASHQDQAALAQLDGESIDSFLLPRLASPGGKPLAEHCPGTLFEWLHAPGTWGRNLGAAELAIARASPCLAEPWCWQRVFSARQQAVKLKRRFEKRLSASKDEPFVDSDEEAASRVVWSKADAKSSVLRSIAPEFVRHGRKAGDIPPLLALEPGQGAPRATAVHPPPEFGLPKHPAAIEGCIDSLSSASGSVGVDHPALVEVRSTLRRFPPLCLFEHWSVAPSSSARPLELDPKTVRSTGTYSPYYGPVHASLPGAVGRYWSGPTGVPSTFWECNLREPAIIEQVRVVPFGPYLALSYVVELTRGREEKTVVATLGPVELVKHNSNFGRAIVLNVPPSGSKRGVQADGIIVRMRVYVSREHGCHTLEKVEVVGWPLGEEALADQASTPLHATHCSTVLDGGDGAVFEAPTNLGDLARIEASAPSTALYRILASGAGKQGALPPVRSGLSRGVATILWVLARLNPALSDLGDQVWLEQGPLPAREDRAAVGTLTKEAQDHLWGLLVRLVATSGSLALLLALMRAMSTQPTLGGELHRELSWLFCELSQALRSSPSPEGASHLVEVSLSRPEQRDPESPLGAKAVSRRVSVAGDLAEAISSSRERYASGVAGMASGSALATARPSSPVVASSSAAVATRDEVVSMSDATEAAGFVCPDVAEFGGTSEPLTFGVAPDHGAGVALRHDGFSVESLDSNAYAASVQSLRPGRVWAWTMRASVTGTFESSGVLFGIAIGAVRNYVYNRTRNMVLYRPSNGKTYYTGARLRRARPGEAVTIAFDYRSEDRPRLFVIPGGAGAGPAIVITRDPVNRSQPIRPCVAFYSASRNAHVLSPLLSFPTLDSFHAWHDAYEGRLARANYSIISRPSSVLGPLFNEFRTSTLSGTPLEDEAAANIIARSCLPYGVGMLPAASFAGPDHDPFGLAPPFLRAPGAPLIAPMDEVSGGGPPTGVSLSQTLTRLISCFDASSAGNAFGRSVTCSVDLAQSPRIRQWLESQDSSVNPMLEFWETTSAQGVKGMACRRAGLDSIGEPPLVGSCMDWCARFHAVESLRLGVSSLAVAEEPSLDDDEIAVSISEWACNMCTLINRPESHHCEVCGAARPQFVPDPQHEEEWLCSVCSFANSQGYNNCIMCGNKRASQSRGVASPSAAVAAKEGIREVPGSHLSKQDPPSLLPTDSTEALGKLLSVVRELAIRDEEELLQANEQSRATGGMLHSPLCVEASPAVLVHGAALLESLEAADDVASMICLLSVTCRRPWLSHVRPSVCGLSSAAGKWACHRIARRLVAPDTELEAAVAATGGALHETFDDMLRCAPVSAAHAIAAFANPVDWLHGHLDGTSSVQWPLVLPKSAEAARLLLSMLCLVAVEGHDFGLGVAARDCLSHASAAAASGPVSLSFLPTPPLDAVGKLLASQVLRDPRSGLLDSPASDGPPASQVFPAHYDSQASAVCPPGEAHLVPMRLESTGEVESACVPVALCLSSGLVSILAEDACGGTTGLTRALLTDAGRSSRVVSMICETVSSSLRSITDCDRSISLKDTFLMMDWSMPMMLIDAKGLDMRSGESSLQSVAVWERAAAMCRMSALAAMVESEDAGSAQCTAYDLLGASEEESIAVAVSAAYKAVSVGDEAEIAGEAAGARPPHPGRMHRVIAENLSCRESLVAVFTGMARSSAAVARAVAGHVEGGISAARCGTSQGHVVAAGIAGFLAKAMIRWPGTQALDDSAGALLSAVESYVKDNHLCLLACPAATEVAIAWDSMVAAFTKAFPEAVPSPSSTRGPSTEGSFAKWAPLNRANLGPEEAQVAEMQSKRVDALSAEERLDEAPLPRDELEFALGRLYSVAEVLAVLAARVAMRTCQGPAETEEEEAFEPYLRSTALDGFGASGHAWGACCWHQESENAELTDWGNNVVRHLTASAVEDKNLQDTIAGRCKAAAMSVTERQGIGCKGLMGAAATASVALGNGPPLQVYPPIAATRVMVSSATTFEDGLQAMIAASSMRHGPRSPQEIVAAAVASKEPIAIAISAMCAEMADPSIETLPTDKPVAAKLRAGPALVARLERILGAAPATRRHKASPQVESLLLAACVRHAPLPLAEEVFTLLTRLEDARAWHLSEGIRSVWNRVMRLRVWLTMASQQVSEAWKTSATHGLDRSARGPWVGAAQTCRTPRKTAVRSALLTSQARAKGTFERLAAIVAGSEELFREDDGAHFPEGGPPRADRALPKHRPRVWSHVVSSPNELRRLVVRKLEMLLSCPPAHWRSEGRPRRWVSLGRISGVSLRSPFLQCPREGSMSAERVMQCAAELSQRAALCPLLPARVHSLVTNSHMLGFSPAATSRMSAGRDSWRLVEDAEYGPLGPGTGAGSAFDASGYDELTPKRSSLPVFAVIGPSHPGSVPELQEPSGWEAGWAALVSVLPATMGKATSAAALNELLLPSSGPKSKLAKVESEEPPSNGTSAAADAALFVAAAMPAVDPLELGGVCARRTMRAASRSIGIRAFRTLLSGLQRSSSIVAVLENVRHGFRRESLRWGIAHQNLMHTDESLGCFDRMSDVERLGFHLLQQLQHQQAPSPLVQQHHWKCGLAGGSPDTVALVAAEMALLARCVVKCLEEGAKVHDSAILHSSMCALALDWEARDLQMLRLSGMVAALRWVPRLLRSPPRSRASSFAFHPCALPSSWRVTPKVPLAALIRPEIAKPVGSGLSLAVAATASVEPTEAPSADRGPDEQAREFWNGLHLPRKVVADEQLRRALKPRLQHRGGEYLSPTELFQREGTALALERQGKSFASVSPSSVLQWPALQEQEPSSDVRWALVDAAHSLAVFLASAVSGTDTGSLVSACAGSIVAQDLERLARQQCDTQREGKSSSFRSSVDGDSDDSPSRPTSDTALSRCSTESLVQRGDDEDSEDGDSDAESVFDLFPSAHTPVAGACTSMRPERSVEPVDLGSALEQEVVISPSLSASELSVGTDRALTQLLHLCVTHDSARQMLARPHHLETVLLSLMVGTARNQALAIRVLGLVLASATAEDVDAAVQRLLFKHPHLNQEAAGEVWPIAQEERPPSLFCWFLLLRAADTWLDVVSGSGVRVWDSPISAREIIESRSTGPRSRSKPPPLSSAPQAPPRTLRTSPGPFASSYLPSEAAQCIASSQAAVSLMRSLLAGGVGDTVAARLMWASAMQATLEGAMSRVSALVKQDIVVPPLDGAFSLPHADMVASCCEGAALSAAAVGCAALAVLGGDRGGLSAGQRVARADASGEAIVSNVAVESTMTAVLEEDTRAMEDGESSSLEASRASFARLLNSPAGEATVLAADPCASCAVVVFDGDGVTSGVIAELRAAQWLPTEASLGLESFGGLWLGRAPTVRAAIVPPWLQGASLLDAKQSEDWPLSFAPAIGVCPRSLLLLPDAVRIARVLHGCAGSASIVPVDSIVPVVCASPCLPWRGSIATSWHAPLFGSHADFAARESPPTRLSPTLVAVLCDILRCPMTGRHVGCRFVVGSTPSADEDDEDAVATDLLPQFEGGASSVDSRDEASRATMPSYWASHPDAVPRTIILAPRIYERIASALVSRATSALGALLALPGASETALGCGSLAAVMKVALEPAPLPSFVSRGWLLRHRELLLALQLAARRGLRVQGQRLAAQLGGHAPRLERLGSAQSAEPVMAEPTPPPPVSELDGAISRLCEMGFSRDDAGAALVMGRGSVARATEWLLSGKTASHARHDWPRVLRVLADREHTRTPVEPSSIGSEVSRSRGRTASSAGFRASASKTSLDASGDPFSSARAVVTSLQWGASLQLAHISRRPQRLCWHALELFSGDSDAALIWLLEQSRPWADPSRLADGRTLDSPLIDPLDFDDLDEDHSVRSTPRQTLFAPAELGDHEFSLGTPASGEASSIPRSTTPPIATPASATSSLRSTPSTGGLMGFMKRISSGLRSAVGLSPSSPPNEAESTGRAHTEAPVPQRSVADRQFAGGSLRSFPSSYRADATAFGSPTLTGETAARVGHRADAAILEAIDGPNGEYSRAGASNPEILAALVGSALRAQGMRGGSSRDAAWLSIAQEVVSRSPLAAAGLSRWGAMLQLPPVGQGGVLGGEVIQRRIHEAMSRPNAEQSSGVTSGFAALLPNEAPSDLRGPSECVLEVPATPSGGIAGSHLADHSLVLVSSNRGHANRLLHAGIPGAVIADTAAGNRIEVELPTGRQRIVVDDLRSVEALLGVPVDDVAGYPDRESDGFDDWEAVGSARLAEWAARCASALFGAVGHPAVSCAVDRIKTDEDGCSGGMGGSEALERGGVVPWLLAAHDAAIASTHARRVVLSLLVSRASGAAGPREDASSCASIVRDAGGAAQLVTLVRMVTAGTEEVLEDVGGESVSASSEPTGEPETSEPSREAGIGGVAPDESRDTAATASEEPTGVRMRLGDVTAAVLSHLVRRERDEGGRDAQIGDLAPHSLVSAPQRAGLVGDMSPSSGGGSLAKTLLEDAAWSLLRSSSPRISSEWEIRESLHPHHPRCDYVGQVSVPGAMALRVAFDPRCALSSGCMLWFFTDARLSTPVATLSGDETQFRPFVLHASTFWYRLRCLAQSPPKWGFRFRASPLWGIQWLCEVDALRAPSLGWATRLIDLLLSLKLPELDVAVHSNAFADALVAYLRSPGLPFKTQVAQRLTALLRKPWMFAGSLGTSLSAISSLEPIVLERVSKLRAQQQQASSSGSSPPIAPALQVLCELCATVKAAGLQSSRMRRVVDRTLELETDDREGVSVVDNMAAVMHLGSCLLLKQPPSDRWLLLVASLAFAGKRVASSRISDRWVETVIASCMVGDVQLDEDIVSLAGNVAKTPAGLTSEGKPATSPMNLSPTCLVVPPEFVDMYPRLQRVDLVVLRCRFALLQLMNRVVACCVDYVLPTGSDSSSHVPHEGVEGGHGATSSSPAASAGPALPSPRAVDEDTVRSMSAGQIIRGLGAVVLAETKTRLVEEAIDVSWERPRQPSMPLVIDNALAFQTVDAGITDATLSQCVFVQAFDQLMRWPASRYRERLDNRERLFVVSYHGEEGIDWGGLYREALTRAVEDCFPPAGAASAVGTRAAMEDAPAKAAAASAQEAQSSLNGLRSWLASFASGPAGDASSSSSAPSDKRELLGTGLGIDLFLPTPNARQGVGSGQEKFVPNVKHRAPRQMKMFEFVGRLMGLSMRQRLYLSFELPSLVWKLLAGQSSSLLLRDLAEMDVQTANLIERALAIGKGTESPVEGLVFAVAGSDGSSLELFPGGATTPVKSRADHRRWATLALRRRLCEFEEHVALMRKGLLGVVPERAVAMCSWSELEVHVCGDPRIDIDVLEHHTVLDGFSSSDRQVKALFRVLRSFSQIDRSRFVRFVWGRSRLPRGSKWPRPFRLSLSYGGDATLPVAHSCFFNLAMPSYSSETILRKRLVAALDYGMDGFLLA